MYEQDPYTAQAGAAVFWFMLAIVVVSAIAVYVDAKRIGARKGLVTGIANNSPGMWAFGVIAMWILVLPIYLANRDKLKTAAAADRRGDHQPRFAPSYQQTGWGPSPYAPGFGPAPAYNPGPVMPPAGWYEDPERRDCNRWWDGHQWTEHRTLKPY